MAQRGQSFVELSNPRPFPVLKRKWKIDKFKRTTLSKVQCGFIRSVLYDCSTIYASFSKIFKKLLFSKNRCFVLLKGFYCCDICAIDTGGQISIIFEKVSTWYIALFVWQHAQPRVRCWKNVFVNDWALALIKLQSHLKIHCQEIKENVQNSGKIWNLDFWKKK